jgi:uncharacterized protein YjgD (DUF1641 family)
MQAEEEINEEVLKQLVNLINNLEKKNVLKLLNSIVEKSDELIESLTTWLLKPDNINAIKNLLLIVGFSKNVEFDKLQKLTFALSKGINKGVEEMKKEKKLGLISIIRMINDPDINRSIRVILAVLKGMGEALK